MKMLRRISVSRWNTTETEIRGYREMIIGKSKRELEKMRASGRLVGLVLQHLRTLVKPGITTIEIDREAEKMIRDAGALPTFKGYNGFPYSICASVNEQIVHGFLRSMLCRKATFFRSTAA